MQSNSNLPTTGTNLKSSSMPQIASKPPLLRARGVAMQQQFDGSTSEIPTGSGSQQVTTLSEGTNGGFARTPSTNSIASTVSSSPLPTLPIPPASTNSGGSGGESADSSLPASASIPGQLQVAQADLKSNSNLTNEMPFNPRGTVHIVWSMTDVPLPSSCPPTYAIDRVHRIAEAYGCIASFKVIAINDSVGGNNLTHATKKILHDHGIELEEVYALGSIDLAIMTNLLRIGMAEVEQQIQVQHHSRVSTGSTLILLSNQEELSRALHVLRRSSRFTNVVVIWHHRPVGHLLPLSAHEPISLIRHATISFEWSHLLKHGLPPHTVLQFEQPTMTMPMIGARMMPAKDQTLLPARSSMTKDIFTFAQPGRPPSTGTIYPNAPSTGSSTFHSRSTTPSSCRSLVGSAVGTPNSSLVSNTFNFGTPATNSRSSSISSLPSIDSASAMGGRSMMGAVLDVVPALDSDTTNIGELSVELMIERLPAKVKAMVIAFKTVLEYCEKEKIIPRESVLKKRLLDTSIGFGAQLADVDFEQLLDLSVQCGVAAVEGVAPQRIIYPACSQMNENGQAMRKFECADFFQPTQRLTVDETYELLAFLSRERPEVDRGRFGFAQFLSVRAPPLFRAMPHGVLVELVQLLLNQKILLFRKGRVSTSPNLMYADLHALAALSVASRPHAALLSTTKGPAGQQAAQQIKMIYAQIQHDVDAMNERKAIINATNPSVSATRDRLQPVDILPPLRLGLAAHPTRPASAPASPTVVGKYETSLNRPLAGSYSMASWPHGPNQATHDSSLISGDVGFGLSPVCEFATDALDAVIQPDSLTVTTNSPNSLVSTPLSHSQIGTPSKSLYHFDPTRWKATPPFVRTSDMSYARILAHKFMESKWGPSSHQLSQNQRFPLAPLWHLELSVFAGGSPSNHSHRWSAICAFDVSGEVHGFSDACTYDQPQAAMDGLACQILQQPILWRLIGLCALREMKIRRHSSINRLPFLIADAGELESIESTESLIAARMDALVQAQVGSQPLLCLDALLSTLSQPTMIYSCERMKIGANGGQRVISSVAAALPNQVGEKQMGEPFKATSLKENKVDAKLECARLLLDQLHRSQAFSIARRSSDMNGADFTLSPVPPPPPPSSVSSRPTMNPNAAVWTPTSSSDTSQPSPIRQRSGTTGSSIDESSYSPPIASAGDCVGCSPLNGSTAIVAPRTSGASSDTPDFDVSGRDADEDEEAQYLSDWNTFAQHQRETRG